MSLRFKFLFLMCFWLASCSPQPIASPTISATAASANTVPTPSPTLTVTQRPSITPISATMTPIPSNTPTITPTEDPYHPFPEQSPNGLYTAKIYQNWPDPERLAIFDAGGRMIWEVTSILETTTGDPAPYMKLVGWSKDGNSFYFCYQFTPDGGDYAFLWDGYDLQRLDIATGDVEQVIEDNGLFSFAFSPDGLFLAYARNGDEPEAIIIRDMLSGKETRRILPATERDIIRVGDIHWSPSGSGLVFQTEEEEWMVQTFFLDIQAMHLRLIRRYELYELFLEGWENDRQVRYNEYPQNMILLLDPLTGQESILGTQTPVAPINLAPTRTPHPSATPTATTGVTDKICTPPMRNWGEEVSPDGLWVATTCLGETNTSFLQVQTVVGDITWIVKLADYNQSNPDFDSVIRPFYWSTKYGSYLYVTSPSRFSGCCWIGGDSLLARLDLTNGNQVEIANYIGDSLGATVMANFSISKDERYVISIPQDDRNMLYLLDQFTWKQKTIPINYQNTGAGYAVISGDGQKIVLMLREYPEVYQGDLTYGSLLLINLEDDSQRKLISGMEFEDTPIPIAWQDADHVVLSRDQELFLLNIQTAELTPTNQATLTPVSP